MFFSLISCCFPLQKQYCSSYLGARALYKSDFHLETITISTPACSSKYWNINRMVRCNLVTNYHCCGYMFFCSNNIFQPLTHRNAFQTAIIARHLL